MIHYKFKSAKDFDAFECDGPSMSAYDIKLHIAEKAGLIKVREAKRVFSFFSASFPLQ